MLAALGCGATQLSCSVLLDWQGFSGGRSSDAGHADATVDGTDAGLDADPDAGGGPEAATLESCGTDKLCSPPVPAVPGWSGPYALLTGAPGSLPTCDTMGYATQSAYDGMDGLDGGAAQCGCSCGPPQGLGCDPPTVTFFSDTLCNDACSAAKPVTGCVTIDLCATSLEVSGPTASAGATCAPDASVAVPSSGWSGSARACSPSPDAPQGSCASGGLCLPATTPFCILQQGDVPCPTGSDYGIRRVYYEGSTDGRGCAPCTCSAPVGTACTFPPGVPPVFSFPSTGCSVPTGNPYFAPTNPPCTGKLGTVGALELTLEPTIIDAGTCTPSTPTPSGSLTPMTGSTFCCTR